MKVTSSFQPGSLPPPLSLSTRLKTGTMDIVNVRQSTAQKLIAKVKMTPPLVLASWRKNSRPPSLLHPSPGSTCRVVHLPHSSPCHQVAAGRGYLHSQLPEKNKRTNEQTNAGRAATSRKIGRYWADLPGNLRSPG